MQSNSLVKFVLAILFISCAFQFALLIPIKQIENKAMHVAYLAASKVSYEKQEEAYQFYYNEYIESASDKVVFSIPYISDYTYQSLKDRQLQLGLDLKGGVQFTLSFDSEAFLKNLIVGDNNPSCATALIKANQQTGLSHPAYIDAFFDSYQQLEDPATIIHLFSQNPQFKNSLHNVQTIEQLKNHVNALSQTMINNTKDLLIQRLNHTGLGQANLNVDSDRHHVQIEVPGANDQERIRGLITDVASLEFWNVYRVTDPGILESFVVADQLLMKTE